MKKGFREYLTSIGMTKALQARVEAIHEFYTKICPEEIADAVVTEYLKDNGSREYQNLWFFSEKYWMEAKNFATEDDFDITPAQKRVIYYRITKRDYDFEKATQKSRLVLEANLDTGITGELRATEDNCDHCRDIILKYVKPNLKE